MHYTQVYDANTCSTGMERRVCTATQNFNLQISPMMETVWATTCVDRKPPAI